MAEPKERPAPVDCSACDAMEEGGQPTTKHTHAGTDRRGRPIRLTDIDPSVRVGVVVDVDAPNRQLIRLKCSGIGCGTVLEIEMNVTPERVVFSATGEHRGASSMPADYDLGSDEGQSYCRTTVTAKCYRCARRGF